MANRQRKRHLSAFNSAKDSENMMHDDTVARRYGFAGGLVTGVDIFAYMAHMPVEKWGRDFLDRGVMEARFLKPVYDGEEVAVIAEGSEDAMLAVRVESRGEICATALASLPAVAPLIDAHGYRATSPIEHRTPVDADAFAVDKWLGTAPQTWDAATSAIYLGEVREDAPLYHEESLVHPGILQRMMNEVLVENAILGPWIHVGSKMQMLAAPHFGDALTARAKVVGNYERKGHRFVELDALIVASDDVPIARCWHLAIWQPRIDPH
jgi:acyl dehydratase